MCGAHADLMLAPRDVRLSGGVPRAEDARAPETAAIEWVSTEDLSVCATRKLGSAQRIQRDRGHLSPYHVRNIVNGILTPPKSSGFSCSEDQLFFALRLSSNGSVRTPLTC